MIRTASLKTLSVLLLSATILTNCNQKETKIIREAAPTEQGTPKPAVDGTSSGGGSFGDESSMYILNEAKNDLILRLTHLEEEVIQDLPEGWTKERIISVLENVRVSKNSSISRYDRELMFNYGQDASTGEPYIEALELFFKSHAPVPINHMSADEFYPVLSEIRLKLIHEIAHLLGIGLSEDTDENARKFATALIHQLTGALVFCISENPLHPFDNWLRTKRIVSWDKTCLETRTGSDYDKKRLKAAELEAYIDRESADKIVNAPKDWQRHLNFEIVIDRLNGRATTKELPGSEGYRWYGYDYLYFREMFLFDSDSLRNRFLTISPNLESQYGVPSDIVYLLNNFRVRQDVRFFEEGIHRHFFSPIETAEGRSFSAVLKDIDVFRSTMFSLPSDLSVDTQVHLSNLSETLTFVDDFSSALLRVDQKADLICDNGEKRVPSDYSGEISLTCEAKQLTPVSINDYL